MFESPIPAAMRLCPIKLPNAALLLAAWLCNLSSLPAQSPPQPCRIEVVDKQTGWPVPLVQLTTTHQVKFVSDNAGVIAIDDPSLLDREVWFDVVGHGYGVPADGFGYRGVRLTPRSGKTMQLPVTRTAVAKRLGRLTGTGLFAESQKLGDQMQWQDSPIFGCDSVQTAIHQGKVHWAWGDTLVGHYPLGIFDMTGATTASRPFTSLEPPLRPQFDYYLDDAGLPAAVAPIDGDGPTWITGYVSLPDCDGNDHLVAFYRKIKPPLEVIEGGLCIWNPQSRQFEHDQTVWTKGDPGEPPTLIVDGHPSFWTDPQGQRWLYFGNPLPRVRLPATLRAWRDPSQWEPLSPQQHLRSAADQSLVEPHSGSIAYSGHRGRWVTVFVEKFGKASPLGTLWYAEADQPTGPWGPAVQILAHQNYTFYNPRLHAELLPDDSPVLLFEGTYTAQFADHAKATPRYDYNQILYRLDFDDPALQPARRSGQSNPVQPTTP